MKSILAACLLTGLIAVPVVRGAVVFSDTFSYGDGSITNTAGNAAGSTWTNHSGTGTFIQVTNGVAYTIGGSGSREDVSAPLGGAPYTNGFLYVGFDLTLIQDFSASGDYFLHFKDSANGFRGRVFLSETNTPSGGDFAIGLDNDGGSSSVLWGGVLLTNTTYRIVLGYDVANRVSSLWVDPSEFSSSNITDSVAGSFIAVSQIAIRQGGTNTGVQGIDNLIVGTAFEDVVTVVPEPSQIAMFGLGALGLVVYRLRSARRR